MKSVASVLQDWFFVAAPAFYYIFDQIIYNLIFF